MKAPLLLFLLAMAIPAAAQSADAIYHQACGPKDAEFVVKQVKGQPLTGPAQGKALVYFIQKESGGNFTTRVGLDGAWAGVIKHDSYIAVSVVPGEHHACVATQDRKHPKADFVHFTAEAGKVYYYLVRGISATPGVGVGIFETMVFGPADRDEALYLIASNPRSVATQQP